MFNNCLLAVVPLAFICMAVTATSATPAPTSTMCYSINNAYYVVCAENQECCGSGTMNPSCIDPTTTQCCTWYLDSTTCGLDQTCCGAGGPGASSSAMCCGAGTTCCSSYDTYDMQCCTSSQTCGGSFSQPQCVAK